MGCVDSAEDKCMIVCRNDVGVYRYVGLGV